jgi:hypothetical protein
MVDIDREFCGHQQGRSLFIKGSRIKKIISGQKQGSTVYSRYF